MKLLQLMVVGIIAIASFSCKKDKKTSAEQVTIQKIVSRIGGTDCTCDPAIWKYKYKGDTIYALLYLGPTCNFIPTYYDAEGNQIEVNDDLPNQDYMSALTLISEVWKCSKSK